MAVPIESCDQEIFDGQSRVFPDREWSQGIVLDAYWWLWNNSFLAKDEGKAFAKWFFPIVRHFAITARNR